MIIFVVKQCFIGGGFNRQQNNIEMVFLQDLVFLSCSTYVDKLVGILEQQHGQKLFFNEKKDNLVFYLNYLCKNSPLAFNGVETYKICHYHFCGQYFKQVCSDIFDN